MDNNFNKFHLKLCDIIDLHAPETEKKISAKNIIQNPFFTKGILTSLKKQKRLYKHMLEVKTDASKEKYTNYRNQLKKIMRKWKSKYLHDKCTEYKQDSSKLWKLINRMIGRENNKTHVIDSIRSSNLLKTDPYSITSTFNDFFSTIGKTYAEKHHASSQEIRTNIDNTEQNQKSIFLQPCTGR